MAMINKITQFLKDLALVTLILAVGTIAFIAVSPWLLAAYLRNRKQPQHELL